MSGQVHSTRGHRRVEDSHDVPEDVDLGWEARSVDETLRDLSEHLARHEDRSLPLPRPVPASVSDHPSVTPESGTPPLGREPGLGRRRVPSTGEKGRRRSSGVGRERPREEGTGTCRG